jgi:hypothetical protein
MTSCLESDFLLYTCYYYTTLNMSSETIVSTYIHNNMYHNAVNRLYNNIELNSFYSRLWRHRYARQITRKHELNVKHTTTCVFKVVSVFLQKRDNVFRNRIFSSIIKLKNCHPLILIVIENYQIFFFAEKYLLAFV